MKRYFYTLLHLFHPAGMEPLQVNQTQSLSNVQPYYNAGDLPAKENVPMIKKVVLTVLIVLTALTLSACGLGNKRLSRAEGAAYAAEVDEIVENLLVGYSECDFDVATRDFDSAWEGFFEKNPFQPFCEKLIGDYGAYQSKTFDHVEDQQGSRVVIYHVAFEKVPDVTVSVSFYIDDPDHLINGLMFGDQ